MPSTTQPQPEALTPELEAGDKPGVRTSEFWMTIVFHVVAVVLAALGTIEAEWAVAASAAVQSVYAVSRGYVKGQPSIKLPPPAGAMLLALLLVLASCVVPGCASATSDRGTLGETIAAIDLDFNFDGLQRESQPEVAIDDTGAYYEPVVNAVEAATEDGEVTGQEAATIQKAAASLGPGVNLVVIEGGITVTVTGRSDTASSGDTTQTPTGPDVDAKGADQVNVGGAGVASGE